MITFAGVAVALAIIAFGVYKFIVANNINQQIASALVGIFGLQLISLMLWIIRK